LFFLYPRYVSDQLNDVPFQVTLTGSLLTIFLFGISGVHYFEVVAMARASIETKMQLIRRGGSAFRGEPASRECGTSPHPLHTRIVVGVIATVLWTLYAVFLIRQGRKLRVS